MSRVLSTFAAVSLLVTCAFAQYWVEADLNGVVGDPQPDSIVTTGGQEVPIDLWFMGSSSPIFSFQMTLCNPDHSLNYQNTQFYNPEGMWGLAVTGPDSSGCYILVGYDAQFEGWIICPYKIATVAYLTAVDHSIADLVLAPGSAVMNATSGIVPFSNNGEVLARIEIGDVTGTEATSWGGVKALFR